MRLDWASFLPIFLFRGVAHLADMSCSDAQRYEFLVVCKSFFRRFALMKRHVLFDCFVTLQKEVQN